MVSENKLSWACQKSSGSIGNVSTLSIVDMALGRTLFESLLLRATLRRYCMRFASSNRCSSPSFSMEIFFRRAATTCSASFKVNTLPSPTYCRIHPAKSFLMIFLFRVPTGKTRFQYGPWISNGSQSSSLSNQHEFASFGFVGEVETTWPAARP